MLQAEVGVAVDRYIRSQLHYSIEPCLSVCAFERLDLSY